MKRGRPARLLKPRWIGYDLETETHIYELDARGRVIWREGPIPYFLRMRRLPEVPDVTPNPVNQIQVPVAAPAPVNPVPDNRVANNPPPANRAPETLEILPEDWDITDLFDFEDL
jgi:hypothetical protein